MPTLDQANVVLLPTQLNVAAVQQLWLVDQGILTRDDLSEQSLFTPIAVNVKARFFELLILPNQIQVAARTQVETPADTIPNVVTKLIAALSAVSYSACGLNFHCWVTVRADQMSSLSRRICIKDDHPWKEAFSSDTAHFGFYASRDIFGYRLRADVKPAVRRELKDSGSSMSGFTMSFNFHKDLVSSEAVIEEMTALIGKWNEARAYALKLAEQLEERVPANV